MLLLYVCGYKLLQKDVKGQIAQLVEHRTENPGVAGSIPALPTTYYPGGMSKFRVSISGLFVTSNTC